MPQARGGGCAMTRALTTNRLTEIAETVNAEHAKIEGVLREGLARAVNVGQLLTEAKGLVNHGEWGAWIADKCRFSERTAQNYMRIAAKYPELTAKSATVADLTYRKAIALLADPKPSIDQDPPESLTPQKAYALEIAHFEKLDALLNGDHERGIKADAILAALLKGDLRPEEFLSGRDLKQYENNAARWMGEIGKMISQSKALAYGRLAAGGVL